MALFAVAQQGTPAPQKHSGSPPRSPTCARRQ
jgi:hypothetical protein